VRYLIYLLLAVGMPLSAQIPETITLEPADVDITNVINLDSITLILPPPDSASVARDEAAQRAMDAIAEYLENCDCTSQGPNNVTVMANAALTVAAFLIVWQLRGIKNKDYPEHPDHPSHPTHPDHPSHPDDPLHPSHPDHPEDPSHPSHPDPPDHPSHPVHLDHPDHPDDDNGEGHYEK